MSSHLWPVPGPKPMHACSHPECSEPTPTLMWACHTHWMGLPPLIRQAIWWADREADAAALEVAKQRAFAYWHSHGDQRAIEPLVA